MPKMIESIHFKFKFQGERFSMLFLLPRDSGFESLRSLSRDMLHTPITTLLSELHEEEVIVQLPKFDISNKLDLRAYLSQVRTTN